ncbi:ABC transporter permease [Allomuricauda sp. SCSIO 65647]|uniref:ABC transporter permease n=1 Tax=Allomuricauda sp. SCSIO 65647 TaxID=2908843 RepID=UPI001F34E730|nr:ABC transporter permease [Muricauda sp. SCSIO 65647]UJH69159.1 ABC transporter permease [Muricauda sp. SCSIO 65647]
MFKNQLKIAWRSLLKRKVFSLINILGLAIGFGCATLIFLFVNHHLSYDKFHHNSERIFRFVTEQQTDIITHTASVPPGFSNAFKKDYTYATKMAKMIYWGDEVLTIEDRNLKIKLDDELRFVEADFFKIFNFPLVNGSGDVPITEPNTAVITEDMALRLFGHENPIGKSFLLGNTELITITGVLKQFPETTMFTGKVFVSFATISSFFDFVASESWGGITSNLMCFGLLHPNQDIAAIERNLTEYPKKFRPKSKNKHVYKLQPLADIHLNTKYGGNVNRKTLWIFSLIGLFILGMACINFINISTGQSFYRSKEVGLRKVVGGLKNQLFWQFMVETLLTGFLALLVGIGICFLVLPWFNSLFDLSLSLKNMLDVRFIGFLMLLLLLVTFLAGSYPGVLLAKVAPILALKNQLSTKDMGRSITRKTLVITQFVIAIVLIVGTIVINQQIEYAISSDLGYEKNSIVMVEIPNDNVEGIQLKGLKERISNLVGVEKITTCFASPGASNRNWGTSVRYNNKPEDEEFNIQVKAADSDYVGTFEIPILAGRNFMEKDTVDEVLVNKTFAEKVGVSNVNELLGRKLEINGGNVQSKIVGVISDFHNESFVENISPVFIAPIEDYYSEFAININLGQASKILSGIEKEWLKLFPDFVFDYEFLDDRVAEQYEAEQQFLSLTKVFSALAILIGCLGVYGLISFFITQKTKEIGIRKVLGSSLGNILALLAKDFLLMILVAGAIASPIAWLLMNRWLENYKYHTQLSWWIFALAITGVILITVLTIGYKTLRAAQTNPIKSLRTE